MTMYVDRPSTENRTGFAERGHSWNWCHLATDGTIEGLHLFAKSLGIDFAYYHGPGAIAKGTGEVPYYDITPGQRAAAIAKDALDVTSPELLSKAQAHG